MQKEEDGRSLLELLDERAQKDEIGRNAKNDLQFTRNWGDIKEALQAGWLPKEIWLALKAAGRIDFSYQTLLRHIEYWTKRESQPKSAESTAEKNEDGQLQDTHKINHALIAYGLGYENVDDYWKDWRNGTVAPQRPSIVKRVKTFLDKFASGRKDEDDELLNRMNPDFRMPPEFYAAFGLPVPPNNRERTLKRLAKTGHLPGSKQKSSSGNK